MENVVPSHRDVTEMYDLKGSRLGRTAGSSPIKKDNDIARKVPSPPFLPRPHAFTLS